MTDFSPLDSALYESTPEKIAASLRYLRKADAVMAALMPLSTSTPAPPAAVASCEYCDNTGDVHSVTGEWRGTCTECTPAALAVKLPAFIRQMADFCWHVATAHKDSSGGASFPSGVIKNARHLAEQWDEYCKAQQPAAAVPDVETKYAELLYAVESKWPGESRHETALRYICERAEVGRDK